MPRRRPISSTAGRTPGQQRSSRSGRLAHPRRCTSGLWQDRSGNALAIVAAALFPLLALVGSSIDIGRGYLAQSRLQGACDAGALVMRKQLANLGTTDATAIAAADARGQQFFSRNFPNGAYGAAARSFTTQVGTDGAVKGTARISLPMAIMQIFGKPAMPITVTCSAQLNFPNTDVMMVLDTTGSMADTNPGDLKNKIDSLRDVVKNFHTRLEAAKAPGTRVRYGFVPYSVNVNVGGVLKSDWVVNSWRYQGREQRVTYFLFFPTYNWRYQPQTVNVAPLKGATGNDPLLPGSILVPMGGTAAAPAPMAATFRGCMEERDTYEITDYNNVDFTRALDLDIDMVPNTARPETQWRPILHEISFVRSIDSGSGLGSIVGGLVDTSADFLNSAAYGFSACPAPAQKLSTMTGTQMDTYLASLYPAGSTYHDIGMIWGARLISPTGLFAAENADIPGSPTRRNLIFLTDGQTSTLDLSYGPYGIEPLDRRRWSQSSILPLNTVVESRFTVACNEIKRRNVTVWVISFGTSLNPVLDSCAGPGHSFEAANASQLNDAFVTIASQIGNLRLNS